MTTSYSAGVPELVPKLNRSVTGRFSVISNSACSTAGMAPAFPPSGQEFVELLFLGWGEPARAVVNTLSMQPHT
jgi:hypothetical protein